MRVGFARPLGEQKDERTFVAQMSQYPEIVWRLERAAFMQGMSVRTDVVAVGDGGNGLREALEKQFPKLTFILDRPHLKQHLYAGAEAIGLTGIERYNWVSNKLNLIDKGLVKLVIWQLKNYQGQGIKRITNLSEYVERFSDAVHYERFLAQGFPIGSGEVESAITIYSSKAVEDSTLRLGIQIQLIRCSHCELFELMAGGRILDETISFLLEPQYTKKPFCEMLS